MACAIEGREGLLFSELEQALCAGHPVVALSVDEMADDLEDAPGFFAFVVVRPRLGEAAEEGVERRGSAGEKGDRVIQIVVDHAS